MSLSSVISDFCTDLVNGIATTLDGLLKNLFYLVFMIENEFNNGGIVTSVDFDAIFRTIYSWAVVVLIVIFAKKMIECYMMWSGGDPDISPLALVVNFVKALVVMVCFSFLYKTFVTIGNDFFISIINSTSIKIESLSGEIGKFASVGLFSILCLTSLAFLYLGIIFQMIMRGVEVLILRVVMPFACVGLLNSDGGAFSVMVKKFLQNLLTVTMQVALIYISIFTMMGSHLIYSIAIGIVALKTPQFLQEFMAVRQGRSVSSRIGGVIQTGANIGRINRSLLKK